MTPLETFVTDYISTLSAGFFFRQFAVIICLFIFGGVLSDALSDTDETPVMRYVLAYPLGICAFAVTAYAMLVVGIPYNTWTVCGAIVLEVISVIFLNRKSFAANIDPKIIRNIFICLAVAVVVALVAVAGVTPVIISNDTMYFYRRYPDCIVYYGGLRDQFDFWMTDTGLAAVAVDTLPALFGFGESFGIREFFHINFLAFFGVCTFEKSGEYITEKKRRIVAAVVITLLLAMSTPFVILGHWGLANMYYMELFFMGAYYTYGNKGKSFGKSAVLLVALALFRIEGTMFVEWLVLCLSYYCGIGKRLAKYVMAPVFVLFGGYCLKIFTQFNILDDIYLFMSPQKAVMLVATVAAVALYVAFIEQRLPDRLRSKLPVAYIAAMILGNGIFYIYDREHYIGNIKAFGANLFRQSGWGMLPYFVIATTVVFAAEYALIPGEKRESSRTSNAFNIVLTIGFILIVLAASFGRGDVLMEDVGDSGNRVLLQITPLIIMMFGELGMSLVKYWDET